MKIARVRWTTYRVPFRTPYVTAHGAASVREGLLVELASDTGLVGLGEAAPAPEEAIAPAALGRALEALAPRLLLRRPAELDLASASADGRAVASALDTAVSDLLAQARGVSVARLLNEDTASSVAVNALVTAAATEEAARAATRAQQAGYSTVKLKVGMASSPDAERERVAAVREAIGPGVRLRLDANGAWSADQAIETIRALEPFDIEYVEQPVAPGNLEALALVQACVPVTIAADEDVGSLEAARRIIETGAARVLILKPQRLGGLRPCRALIEAATAAGVRAVVTTSIEAGSGTAAALQLAATVPGGLAHGLATLDLLADDLILDPGLPIENGRMRLPEGPGLGVRLDEAALTRYATGWREVG